MIRLFEAIRKYENGHKPLYHFALVIFFWAMVDAMISFSMPIYMRETLGNLALTGMVFALSSTCGLFWDLYLGSQQRGRIYKSYLWQGFFLTTLMCFLISRFSSLWWFVVMMAIWGIYFEYIWFGTFDFLDRFSNRWEHAESYGVVQMLRSLGFVLGPVIAGLMITFNKGVNMGVALFLLLICMGAFFTWFHKGDKKILHDEPPGRRLSKFKEMKLWFKVGKKAFWSLVGNFLLNLWESLVLFMGPIFLTAGKLIDVRLSGLVMASFILPTVILPGLTGRWADKVGRKLPMIFGFVLTGVFLIIFGLFHFGFLMILWALCSAVGVAMAMPAANGLLVDVMKKVKIEDEEIVGVRGVASNLGFVIGPLMGGILGSLLGMEMVFVVFGGLMIIGGGMIGLFWRETIRS